MNVEGGLCTSCDGYPSKFRQKDLVDLRIGEKRAAKTGCTPLIGPDQCVNKGFTWPKTNEYVQTNAGICDMCAWAGSYGCSCDCPGSQSVIGTRCAVERAKFMGNKAGCCLIGGGGNTIGTCEYDGMQDCQDSSIQWDKIYLDTYTCNVDMDPYGNSGGVNCPNEVMKVCGNYTSDYLEMFKQWKPDGYCYKWAMNAINTNNPGAVTPVITAALDGFTNFWGVDLTGDGFKPQREHLSNLLKVCSTSPFGQACSPALTRMCARRNFQDRHRVTRDDVSTAYTNVGDLNSSNILSACACHLDEEEYREYVKDGITQGNTNACDPLCKLPGAIQKWDCPTEDSCSEAVCAQNICVIDGVTIDIINSNVGNIDFNITCGGCQGGNCLCIFSDINVLNQASNVGNINFNTSCGGNCYTVDPATGIPDKKVQCPGSGNTPTPGGNSTWWDWIVKEKWLIGIGFVVLVIVGLIIWFRFGAPTQTLSSSTSSPLDGYYPGGLNAYYGQ